MRQNAAIPSDGAYREPSARADCAKTALKSSNTQSKHLADHRVCHAYVSALLRKGAFKVSHVQSALSRAFFSVCPRPRHSFALVQTKTPFPTYPYPKHPFDFGCTQGSPSCSPESKAPSRLPASTPSRSPKSKAALRDYLNPEPLFAIPCIRGAPSRLPEPKAALHDCLHPRPPLTITRVQSPSSSLESKDPLES